MRNVNNIELTVVLGIGSLVAGFFGALTGLGGGVIIIPLLTLVFGIDIRYAVGASLVSVIATSSGAAAAYVHAFAIAGPRSGQRRKNGRNSIATRP